MNQVKNSTISGIILHILSPFSGLSGLSIQLLTLAQVMISGSWDGALSLAPGSVQSVLDIVSLSPSTFPLPLMKTLAKKQVSVKE